MKKQLLVTAIGVGLLGAGISACTPINPVSCSAYAVQPRPVQNSTVAIAINGTPGAKGLVSAQYKNGNRIYRTVLISPHGGTEALYTAGTPGFPVKVTIAVSKNGQSSACSASFTPVAPVKPKPPTPPTPPPTTNPPPQPDPEPAVFSGVPRGSLTSPTKGDTWDRGQRIELRTDAEDATNPGFARGVKVVEWWLYSDTFGAQYPGNHENKIFLGESHMPVFGNTTNGAWTATFVVPAGQTITVTRDGEAPGGLSGPRTYQLPQGIYNVQSHLQNDWWFTNFGDPGKTQMVPIFLRDNTYALR